MDLTEFVLARIAEDEAAARLSGDGIYRSYPDTPVGQIDHSAGGTFNVFLQNRAEHIARWDPARVLAECEAKRRLVLQHETTRVAPGRRELTCAEDGSTTWPCPTLRLLALPYADHPSYRQEWRP